MCPCRYRVTLSTGYFQTFVPKPSGWFHVVLHFIGPDDGIRIYQDGVEVRSARKYIRENPKHNGDRIIVIGRSFAESAGTYSSIQVDELLFFNQMLIDPQVTMLSQLSA